VFQPVAQPARMRVLEAALRLFADAGFDRTSFADIASEAGVAVSVAFQSFPTKEHLALALYATLAGDLEGWAAAELPAGSVAERFAAATRKKLALLAPHRAAFRALAARALDPDGRAAVLGPAAEPVRSAVAGVFLLVVRGAIDAPADAEAVILARALYAVHLLLVCVSLADAAPEAGSAHAALDLVTAGLAGAAPFLGLALSNPAATRADSVLATLIGAPRGAPGRTARLVLERVFRRRRVLPGVPSAPSEAAFALHLPCVQAFVDAGSPVQLVLPGFPAKAPNPAKVLSARADMAERIALLSLADLLTEIAQAHAPGAELVICSDGGVFVDAVGITDVAVAQYREDVHAMIRDLEAPHGVRIRTFDLGDAYGDVGPAAARAALLERWAPSADEIRARAERAPQAAAHLDGIHRFLFEDAVARSAGSTTRTQLRKQTRATAYEVVRRSEAWGRLIGAAFPGALRLSGHPQPDVSDKIGVHFVATEDAWLTPWHGAAVLGRDGYRLMHRRDAEVLGARVIEEGGRPSHMELPP
jgi:pyoverdine/dityrosine biosynthesis protein Dit1/AcrR family transcriptional regulator